MRHDGDRKRSELRKVLQPEVAMAWISVLHNIGNDSLSSAIGIALSAFSQESPSAVTLARTIMSLQSRATD